MQIDLIEIHKHYGSVKANDGVNIKIAAGTIHGLLGENGAGKSTLVKILAGHIFKTSGSIKIDGRPVEFKSPEQAAGHGIGMLYQDPMDFPKLKVLDNFLLGQSSQKDKGRQQAQKRFAALNQEFNFHLNPVDFVQQLTVGERQQLEIIRLMAIGVNTLILDEPTTGISAEQKKHLFDALKKLVSQGRSVVLVSHKLKDVESLCDHVTVLRQGQVSGFMAAPFDSDALLKMMFATLPAPTTCVAGDNTARVLQFHSACASGGRTGLKDCSVTIHAGEVVGLAGLEGSGQSVFLRLAAGLKKPTAGKLQFGHKIKTAVNYHDLQQQGVMFVPAARLEEGLIAPLTITEHVALRKKSGFWLNWNKAQALAHKQIEAFRIKGTPDTPAESLSGGNQQRLQLSFLPAKPHLLLLESPTRGLDVESAQWVWSHLFNTCQNGASIIFASSELDEIIQMASRVLVFFNGRIVKDVQATEIDVNELGQAIAGK